MTRALELAESSIGLSDPNPRVGCVLADRDGSVVSEGFTQAVGEAHAEAEALARAARAGASVQGGCAWVTLEPCAHHGRTPPCCDALIDAGLSRVVIATTDPFPKVAGEGIRRLQAAGVQVQLLATDDPLRQQAVDLNVGFFSRMERGRPWVRLKVAMSVDGRTALPNGVSQWITGEAARIDTHRWRRRASAILTGVGTVLQDDPRLDVRLVPTQLQPLRIVADSHLRTGTRARILKTPGRCVIATLDRTKPHARALSDQGAEVIEVGRSGDRVSMPLLLAWLARQEVNELHVEAGATLNGGLLAEDLVDEIVVYMAPMVLGSGPAIAHWAPVERLEDAVTLALQSCVTIGNDVRLRFGRR